MQRAIQPRPEEGAVGQLGRGGGVWGHAGWYAEPPISGNPAPVSATFSTCRPPPPGLAFGEPDDRPQRGNQYAAGSRLNHNCLWNTGSSGHRRAEATPSFGRLSRALTAAHLAHTVYKDTFQYTH